jgi:hypothetical protein
MAILSEIERQRVAEQVAEFTRNETALAETTEHVAPIPLTDSEKAKLQTFSKWCNARGVRYCPARPATVAVFVSEHADKGSDYILDSILAIEHLHDIHGFANPVATEVVRRTIVSIVKVEPPRSWPGADKALFARLPIDVRAAIARREHQRETFIRRLQNEMAALKANDQKRIEAEPQKTPPLKEKETEDA